MELTDAQHSTLDEIADSTDGTDTRFVVTGADPHTGSLHLRMEQPIRLLPNGMTVDA